MDRKSKLAAFIRQEMRTRNILSLVFILLAVVIVVAAFMGYQNFIRQNRLIIAHVEQIGAYTEGSQFWYVFAFVAVIIISLGIILWYIHRRKSLVFYRTQYNLVELLRENEERYRKLFEMAHDGVFLIDFNTELILDVNPALIELLGYPKDEFLKKHLWNLSAFKDTELPKDKIPELLKKGFFRYEGLTLKTGDGKQILVDLISNAYAVGDKKIIQCDIRDITERKRLESELVQATEMEYRTLLENLPQKVYLKNKNSIFISCNTNYARDLGINPKEIAGKTDFDFFPTYLAQKYRDDDQRVMESGKTENIEEEYSVINDFLGDVQKSFINTVKVPIWNKNGNIKGIFGLFWDITERKQVQDKLHKSQQMFETMVNGITDAVLLLSLDLKILWANRVTPQEFGLTMDEILGRYCYNVTHKSTRRCQSPDHGCPIREVMKTGNPATCIHKHLDKDEKTSFIEITVFPIKNKDGEIIQFLHLQRDITERRQAEEELKRIEDLKTFTEMRMHFTSMVSHELRSPLGAIKEGINLVLEGLAGQLNAEQKDLLDTAKRNVDRLGRLINDVLDFQKIELGRVKFDIRQNDIKEVALEVSNTMGILAKEKGLDLSVEADDNIFKIGFDWDRIIQVLTNLVNNAIRYTEKGKIVIGIKQEANAVHVMVQDTGLGIRLEDMQKLFMAFEQIDDGRRKKKGGTGLGLAISKEIILAHNGKIWAESQVDKGSIFHFTLPIKERRG